MPLRCTRENRQEAMRQFSSDFLQIPAKKLPIRECIKLERALGMAVLGSTKWVFASTAPSPEFCIPTSMDIVRWIDAFW